MKVIYISKSILPSMYANSVHVAKISDEFRQICDEFVCVILGGRNVENKAHEIADFYGLKGTFNIIGLEPPKIKIVNSNLKFAWDAGRIIKREKPDVVITRDPLTAFFSVMMYHRETVLDLHADLRYQCGKSQYFFHLKRFIYNKKFHITVITKALKMYYVEHFKFDANKIRVLPDGVNFEAFARADAKQLEGKTLRLGYVGGFQKDKGIDTIGQLTNILPQLTFYLIGGSREKAEAETGIKFGDNAIFYEYMGNKDVPSYIKGMDAVLLPNRESQICWGWEIGKFTSPLKMFEYMASGVPIIASDVSALREILNEKNCFLVHNPNDVQDWKKVIEYVLENKTEATQKAEAAMMDVQEYTWRKRAEGMLKTIV